MQSSMNPELDAPRSGRIGVGPDQRHTTRHTVARWPTTTDNRSSAVQPKESLDRLLNFQIDWRSMPKLIISGTTYELVDDLVTIERGPDNAIVINNPSVSARHAQLQLAGETYR